MVGNMFRLLEPLKSCCRPFGPCKPLWPPSRCHLEFSSRLRPAEDHLERGLMLEGFSSFSCYHPFKALGSCQVWFMFAYELLEGEKHLQTRGSGLGSHVL